MRKTLRFVVWIAALTLSAGDASPLCAQQSDGSGPMPEGSPSVPAIVSVPGGDDSDVAAPGLPTTPFRFAWSAPGWPVTPSQASGSLTVTVDAMPALGDQHVTMVYELIRVADGATVAREQTDVQLDADGKSEPVSLASSAPEQAGVYEIRCRLVERSDGLWSRFNRSATEHVLVKTPWLVYEGKANSGASNAESQTEDDGGTANERAAGVSFDGQCGDDWADARQVPRIHPDDWQSVNWMPAPASRLVPSVRRVGESLARTAWQTSEAATEYTLKPGETFWGIAEKLARHQTHRFSVQFRTDGRDLSPTPVTVGWAGTPQRSDESRSVTCNVRSTLDLAKVEQVRWAQYEFLHCPARDTEFVWIRNDSDSSDLVIRLVQIAAPAGSISEPGARRPDRQVGLWIESSRWGESLIADLNDQQLDRFAASTTAFYRLWTAVRRMQDVAAWGHCDVVSLPVARGIQQLIAGGDQGGADGPAKRAAIEAVAERVMRRWCSDTQPRIVESDPTGQDTDAAATEGFMPGVVIDAEGADLVNASALCAALGDPAGANVTLKFKQVPRCLSADLIGQLRVFQTIPLGLRPVPAVDPESASRVQLWSAAAESGTDGVAEKRLLYLMNDAPWTSNVELRGEGGQSLQCRVEEPGLTADEIHLRQVGPEGTLLQLPANTLLSLEGTLASDAALRWQATPWDESNTFSRIKAAVAQVVGKSGNLDTPPDYEGLTNGGFETEGQVGIVGWMHTQFPESAVVVDGAEAVEGKRSIRMNTHEKSGGRTWLVSEPIDVPLSGRLAVSLATRSSVPVPDHATGANDNSRIRPLSPMPPLHKSGAPSEPAADPTPKTHRVRVSLEGNDQGKPVRFANEFDVPCDGHWQRRRIVLETDRLDPDRLARVRLTIDSLSEGRLWIDDIHLHDRFATEAEQSALGGKAFLAIQGLQQGRINGAADLLNQPWSRFLLAQSGLPNVAPPDPAANGSPSAMASPAESTPQNARQARMGSTTDKGTEAGQAARRASVAERLRDWLPRPLRF